MKKGKTRLFPSDERLKNELHGQEEKKIMRTSSKEISRNILTNKARTAYKKNFLITTTR